MFLSFKLFYPYTIQQKEYMRVCMYIGGGAQRPMRYVPLQQPCAAATTYYKLFHEYNHRRTAMNVLILTT